MSRFIRFIRSGSFVLLLIVLIIFVVLFAALIMDGKKEQNNVSPEWIYSGNKTEPEKYASETSLPSDEQDNIIKENTSTEETTETVQPATGPPVKKPKKIYQDKFDRIRDMYNGNTDIIGIVKIPGTVINYPVAHYAYDLNEYYLNRNLYKQRSAAGSIFMDFENSVERYDPNTVLYGHQMSSNSMFHSLRYYMEKDYFDSHRYVIFNTIYEDNVWEVFSFFKSNISFNYIKVYFGSEQDFLELAAEITERSIYETGIEIKEGDRILILSTCTNEDRDTRYVLCARMIKNKSDIPENIAKQMENAADDYK